MSDSDSPENKPVFSKKTGKPLAPLEQWKKLIDGLLDEEGIPKKYRATKKERVWLEKEREKVDAAIGEERQRQEAAQWHKSATEMLEAMNTLQEWTEGKKLSSEQIQKLVKALDFVLIEGDKHLTPEQREQTLRLQTALTREADTTPLTEKERAEIAHLRTQLLEPMESGISGWQEKEAKRKAETKKNYIN